jgi:RNA polymerase sigma-70 factor, ECF subfamily
VDIAVQVDAWESGIPDERRLIEQARRDPAALSELYRIHFPAIHAYVVRRVGDKNDADDLTAEVFLTMVRSMWRFRWQGAPFRAWLYRIATNQVNRWASQKRRHVTRQLEEALNKPTAMNSEDLLCDRELLHLALISLPSQFQAALSLYYLEEMSVREVGVVLGCSSGTVKSRLSRGREMLRRYFECRG